MKTLFDENAKYTKDAQNLDAEIQTAVEPIMRSYAKEGFSIRDIYNIAHLTVMDIMTEIILDNDMKRAKLRRDIWRKPTKK